MSDRAYETTGNQLIESRWGPWVDHDRAPNVRPKASAREREMREPERVRERESARERNTWGNLTQNPASHSEPQRGTNREKFRRSQNLLEVLAGRETGFPNQAEEP